MQRRTLLRKFGTGGAVVAGFSGIAAATRPPVTDVGIDRELDVSDVEGAVPLAELLEPSELDHLPDDIDPWRRSVFVESNVATVDPASCCSTGVCCSEVDHCDAPCHCCNCYDCDFNVE